MVEVGNLRLRSGIVQPEKINFIKKGCGKVRSVQDMLVFDCKRLGNLNAYVQNLLSDVGQEEFNVVGVSPLDQAQVDSVRSKRSLQNSLEQTMGSNFNDNSILWNVLDCLVEEYR